VGTAKHILRTGPLAQVQDDILASRATMRSAHGWIMNIYLIRKT
jgi:precorrin-6A synthase